ncbi:hypothetical protein [Streptomyces sp. NPDC026659]
MSEAQITTVELPVLASADADEITLGRQTFNDSDKDNYFEG